MNRLGLLTSGGDAPGMNAAIRAIVRTGHKNGFDLYGIGRGYNGLIHNDLRQLGWNDVSHIIHQGGTVLQSARSADFMTKEGRAKAAESLRKSEIEKLIVLGGEGTFTGAHVFMQEHDDIDIVGVPCTIDNDLYGTDFAIGYDTAINTAMRAIDKIKDTAIAQERAFFIEVMGRDAGYIALRSGIATGSEAVLVPEYPTDIDSLVEKLKARQNHSAIIIVAEGDDAGGAFEIAKKVKEQYPALDTRVSILGYIQRGGSPTCGDRVLASRLGMEAVKAIKRGASGVMIGEVKNDIVEIDFNASTKHTQYLNPTLIEMVNTLN